MKIPVIFKCAHDESYGEAEMVYISDISYVKASPFASDNGEFVSLDDGEPVSILIFNDNKPNLDVLGTPEDIKDMINAAIASHEAMIERARRTPLYATFESAIADRGEVVNLYDIDLSKAEEDTFEAESFNPDDKTRYTTTLPFHKHANREPVKILGSLEEVTQKINDALNNAPSAE